MTGDPGGTEGPESEVTPPQERPEFLSGRPRITADLQTREFVKGRLPGSRYVRIVSPFGNEFTREGTDYLVATERVLAPEGRLARGVDALRRVLIGRRISSANEGDQRVSVPKGLAIFASDNISSSAYATEEIMRVLILAGAAALSMTLPITIAIVVVLVVVVTSYQHTIRAYPGGGGSYIVASENLGPLAGLTGAAALLTDYILTVSVSIAAGVAALTSLFPGLFDYRVVLGVVFIVLLMIGNLRGIRESATVFAAPPYVYLVSMFGLLGYGLFRLTTDSLPEYEAPAHWHEAHGTSTLGLLLVLRAFASGSVALTGTEAVANGVPDFKPPESRNARLVLLTMAACFATIFLGMSVLATALGILPDPSEQETLVSQLTRTLVGAGTPIHYLIQFSTALLLVLAANTAFAGFPRLASILGRDRYLPRQFQFRGDRLAFNVGIVVLSVVAAALLVGFGGSVTNLIPLYMVGVFMAFTLNQAGMVRHWRRVRHEDESWWWRAGLNGVGAAATGVVALIVGVAKFALGAWMVLVLVPILVAVMWLIRRHYDSVQLALALEPSDDASISPGPSPHVVVPVANLDRAALHALAFAQSISDDVVAVHVAEDRDEAEAARVRWERLGGDVRLVIVESPYRSLLPPLLAYIDAVDQSDPSRPITVVLSEFVPLHWWEWFLHNQTALRLKLRLFFRRNTVVIDVPYHLERRNPPPRPGGRRQRL